MKRKLITQLTTLAVSLLLIAGLGLLTAQAKTENDNLFPPGPEAEKFINFDGLGFIINGQRTFITSGSVHYSRVPRENWRDVLLKLKRAGFNTVETYVFWSYHEVHEGQFDFSTDSRDLGAFLDTAKTVGLYAIVRVGPYSCAEWENGGFPNWMYFKPGLNVRNDNKPFMEATDAWFNKMLPIVSSRQIQKGGNVILVQLENEYPAASWKYWGTEIYGSYFQHILDLARINGLEVPMFFSGLNHGHDPAPEVPIDSLGRKSPWMSTELWTIWFDRYGADSSELLKGDRSTWRVLSKGGNGFNLYMAYGGTSFAYDNFSDDRKFGDRRERSAASYDYGTIIGQAGNTRELYTRLKRLGYFAETFSSILADGTNTTAQYQDFATGARITARTAPGGTVVFLDNDAPADDELKKKLHAKTAPGAARKIVLKSGVSLQLAEGEILGLPVNVPIAANVTIAEADTRILGIVSQSNVTTLVCYGEPGDQGQITFDFEGSHSLPFDFVAGQVTERVRAFGTNEVRVLAMSKATADKTWLVDTAAGKQIVIGAPYLGEFTVDPAGKVSATVDYPWNESAPSELVIYGAGNTHTVKLPAAANNKPPETLKLAAWQMSVDDTPLAKGFDDRNWFALPDGNPPAMGADGDYTAFAWYRTRLTNTMTIASLDFARISDRATFFVDGKSSATFDILKQKTPEIALQIPPGEHELAVFIAHFGRPKFSGYVGMIDKLENRKGLSGPVRVNGTNDVLTLNWKMCGGVQPENLKSKWSSVKPTAGAPAYFRTSFKLDVSPESGAAYRLATDGLSFGSVWLNGHNVGRYPEILKDCPGLWLPSCWMKTGDNTLVVFDENGNSPEQARVNLEANASRHRLLLDSVATN